MPRAQPFQTNLSAGELSPKMLGRVDHPIYYSGLKKATNGVGLTQGGITRRPGTRYIGEVPDVGNPTLSIGFEFSESQLYLFVLTHLQAKIYRDDVLEQTLTLPFARTDLDRLNFTQSHDTLLLLDGRGVLQPRKVLRDTTQAVGSQFSVSTLTFTNIPVHAFNDPLSPPPVNEEQRISFAGSWLDGEKFRIRLAGLRTVKIAFSSDDATLAERIQVELRNLANTAIDGITVTVAGGGDFDVEFAGDDGGKDWDEMEVQIVADTDGTASVSTIVEGGSTQEEVWSATRGWPKTAVFSNGRLVLGGSLSRPSTVWASKTGDFYNFDVGDALDDDAIDWTIDSDTVEEIRHVRSSRNLEVLTARGEFYPPDPDLTPSGFSLRRQSQVGCNYVRPVTLDGATLFVDREDRGAHEFLFGALQEGYTTEEISLVSEHLIRTPVSMAVHRTTLADYGWVVNSDGTATVINRKRSQEVAAMTPQVTAGTIECVCALGRELYLTVTRTIDGTPRRFLERLDEDLLTDCAVVLTGTDLDTWSGVDHLDGETVEVIGDGVAEGEQVVTDGEVTTSRPRDEVEVGLGFTPEWVPPPWNLNTEAGPIIGRPKRLTRCTLLLEETDDLYVNNYPIGRRRFGSHALDNPPPKLRGPFDVQLRGWAREATVTLTQRRPGTLTVLAIGLEGSVG